MNRAERRAIAQGKGRIDPMIEIVDAQSAYHYSIMLECVRSTLIYQNLIRSYINYQMDPWDFSDESICEILC